MCFQVIRFLRVKRPEERALLQVLTLPNPLAGAFDGEMRHGKLSTRVSDHLASFGALGGNCGGPPNVPVDITCNQHLDMLGENPASLLGKPSSDIPDADIKIKAWKEQGDNFFKAHVERGAAIVAEGSGVELLMVRRIFARYENATPPRHFSQARSLHVLSDHRWRVSSPSLGQWDKNPHNSLSRGLCW
jgi:hypothetical protein